MKHYVRMSREGIGDCGIFGGGRIVKHDILELAAILFDVTPRGIIGPDRRRHVVSARYAVAWALYRETDMSLAAIGSFLGGRDHTTIIHAVACAEKRAIYDVSYARKLSDLVVR